MAHQPKPFYRSARNAYYVQLGKQQLKLIAGPEDAATEKLAWTEFHKLMADRQADSHTNPTLSLAPGPANSPQTALSVAEVFEKFLDWCQKHRCERTYEWSKKHIQTFCDYLKAADTMATDALRPFHVVEWVDSKSTWGANQKRGAIVAVTRPFNWAAKLGYIAVSPVRGVEKPAPTKRDSTMTLADYTTLLSHVKEGDPFRDLLTFAFEAGCRPQEARLIEARHLKPEHKRIEIPPKEAKGKKRWRVIYLSEKALAIVTRLVELRPSGPLFLNTDRKPWKAQALVCRFQRLLVKLSGPEVNLPLLPRFNYRDYPDPTLRATAKVEHQEKLVEMRKKRASLARQGDQRFAMYDIRHCFATRKLKEGHDPITVATLLGHKDTAMLARHYQELSKDYDHLLDAANGPS